MWDFISIMSVYLLALIGLASVVVIGITLWFAYKYDITFTIRSGNNPRNKNTKGE